MDAKEKESKGRKKKGIGRRREFTKHGRTAIMQTLIIQILGCLNCSTIWMPVPSKPNLQQLEFLEKCSFNSSDSTFIDSANWQHRLLSWIKSKKCYNISMCIYIYLILLDKLIQLTDYIYRIDRNKIKTIWKIYSLFLSRGNELKFSFPRDCK